MSCKFPFSYIEIFPNGDVYPCCPEYCYYYCLGNIFKQSLEDIWYGEKAVALRNRLLLQDYTVCNFSQCFKDVIDILPPDEQPSLDSLPPLPLAVKFSHDKECNCSCITCRDTPQRASQEELDSLNEKIETHFLPLLRNAKVVCLSGAGDPLYSRHSRHLIRRIAETYPDIHFVLHTNGQLCTPTLFDELGILHRISQVQISIHAATKTTYEHIVRGGSFAKLMSNLSYLRDCLNKNSLRKLDLFFVVQSLNVLEIEQAAEIARQHGATIFFWEYRYWGTKFGKNFSEVNVSSPRHSEHQNLLAALRKVLPLPHVRLSPSLKALTRPVEIKPTTPAAIFLHSYYRSSSTWLFEKFRQKGTCCYMEPYHKFLASPRSCLFHDFSSDFLPEHRYPCSHLPYYMEFTALCEGEGSVKGYKEEFHDNIYNYKSLPPDEVAYIQSLIDHAYKGERIPVFGFIRSLLRVGLHKKYFSGVHIVLLRDPHSMYASLLSQDWGGSLHADILRLATDDSIIRRIGFNRPIPDIPFGAQQYSPESWESFCEFFVLFHAIALCHCDMVLDTTRLALDPAYAKDRTAQANCLTGLTLSLDDARFPPGDDDTFYSPAPLRRAFHRYLGNATLRNKLIALAEEYADIPASAAVHEHLDAFEKCLFRKKGDTAWQRYNAEWQQQLFIKNFMQEISQNCTLATVQNRTSEDDKIQQIYAKLEMLENRSVLKAETKKILNRLRCFFPRREQRNN